MTITHCPICNYLLKTDYHTNIFLCTNINCSFNIVYTDDLTEELDIIYYSFYLDDENQYLFLSEKDENRTQIIVRELNMQKLAVYSKSIHTIEEFTPLSQISSQINRLNQLLSFI